MTAVIADTIKQFAHLSDAEISEFMGIACMKQVLAKAHYIRAGQIPKEFGFVIKGLFRYVYRSEEGKEFTKGFMPERSFISSYSAMKAGTGSHFTIEAIEDSAVLTIPYYKWEALRNCNPKWNLLLVGLLEKGYAIKEKREREFLLLDAESRYLVFQKEHPGLEDRLTQRAIASYLGITPVALSRIRRNLMR